MHVTQDEREHWTRHPGRPPVMQQSWKDLLFIHWPVPADVIQDALPAGITVDIFDGFAWIALVPFQMRNVRPVWAPCVPGLSNFPECNVRTYVHIDGKAPGVWFFSLDAGNAIACAIARLTFSLPYFHAKMNGVVRSNTFRYQTMRYKSGLDVSLTATITMGEPVPAIPGTFAWWAAERYLLHSIHKGRLHTGQVHHKPYQLIEASVEFSNSSAPFPLSNVLGAPPASVLYSPGVDVDVFELMQYPVDAPG
ncbi:MAG: YqjF family protein [Armatimonadota bacterium]